MPKTTAQVNTVDFDDEHAKVITRMAEQFYSNPANVEAYEKWHLEKYGCKPNGGLEVG